MARLAEPCDHLSLENSIEARRSWLGPRHHRQPQVRDPQTRFRCHVAASSVCEPSWRKKWPNRVEWVARRRQV